MNDQNDPNNPPSPPTPTQPDLGTHLSTPDPQPEAGQPLAETPTVAPTSTSVPDYLSDLAATQTPTAAPTPLTMDNIPSPITPNPLSDPTPATFVPPTPAAMPTEPLAPAPVTQPTMDTFTPPPTAPTEPMPASPAQFSWPSTPTEPTPPQPQPKVGQPLAETPPPTLSPQDLYGPSSTTPTATTTISDMPMGNTPPLPPSEPSEPAPTDLSHLVNTAENSTIYTPPLSQPETLITSPTAVSDMPTIPTENKTPKIPVWVIGVGIGLLLAAIGTSAYFILGIGKTTETLSAPPAAVQQVIQAPAAIPSPIVATQPEATSSGFGQLPISNPGATSAADLLRQRQGQ